MRLSVALALISMFVSAPVFGAEDDDGGKDKKAEKKKKKKGGDKDATGASMETGTEDPSLSETSDRDAPFAEKSKKVVINKDTGKPEPPPKARPRDPIVAYLEPMIGFGKTFIPASAADQVGAPEGTIVTIEAGGSYDVSPAFTAGLRLAWSTANVDAVAGGESWSATAFAAPLLMGEYRLALSPITSVPLFFALGIPVAEGNPDPSGLDQVGRRKNAVNQLADASHMLRDPELYQPKRFPVVLGAGIRHERSALDLHAFSKFVLAINAGTEIENENYYPGGVIKANGLAIRNVTLAGAAFQFLAQPALSAGLDAWFSFRAIDPIEFESNSDVTQPSSFQFVIEPKLGARFGKLGLGAGFLVPVGGRLGDAGMHSVRLHAEYAL
jgi:hypothetical protein